MNGVIARFWGFDKLIGSALVKVVYYLGLLALLLTLVGGLFAAVTQSNNSGAERLRMAFAIVVSVIVVTVLWRFICEMSILAFQTYNRLGEIRDRLPPPASAAP